VVGGSQQVTDNTDRRSITMSITRTSTSLSTPAGNQQGGESLLTDEALEKVKAIALDEVYGGTVVAIEPDPDGFAAYEVQMLNADGTPTIVYVDASFNLVGIG
jgi:uncharacterized membrane protein YkoI